MTTSNENVSMALFCDFENVALGVRDAKYEKFDIKPVLERLLLKGSIVVKKAYCDWERYKGFKAAMHEANFELIEIPHVRQSGKNSADIRLVVDALDLCYTKSHVDTFVIISGDSDFSPLVSKLRENAKRVIGVGVKQSTSDLLVANCDEFIFYDDLVRESQRQAAKRDKREVQPAVKRTSEEETHRKEELEARKVKAIEIAVETFDALVSEQGDGGKIWASVLKDAIKRRKPDFSEQYYGFRAFGNLLEEARARGLLDVGRDEKSGTFVFRGSDGMVSSEASTRRPAATQEAGEAASETQTEKGPVEKGEPRRKGRGNRRQGNKAGDASREGFDKQNGRSPRNHDLFANNEVATLPPAVPQDGVVPGADSVSGGRPVSRPPSDTGAGWGLRPEPASEPSVEPRLEPPVEWRSAAIAEERSGATESGAVTQEGGEKPEPRRKPQRTRRKPTGAATAEASVSIEAESSAPATVAAPVAPAAQPGNTRRGGRGGQSGKGRARAEVVPSAAPESAAPAAPVVQAAPATVAASTTPPAAKKAARKSAPRARHPRKAAGTPEG